MRYTVNHYVSPYAHPATSQIATQENCSNGLAASSSSRASNVPNPRAYLPGRKRGADAMLCNIDANTIQLSSTLSAPYRIPRHQSLRDLPTTSARNIDVVDLTGDDDYITPLTTTSNSPPTFASQCSQAFKRPKLSPIGSKDGSGAQNKERGVEKEKRVKPWRRGPTQSFLDRLERVRWQKMFLVEHELFERDETPIMSFKLAGSTGNVYDIYIGIYAQCSCPDNLKGNLCKHIIYILVNVLKVPEELQYQRAYLPSELRQMFTKAPQFLKSQTKDEDCTKNRKPIEGDCAICCLEMIEDKEKIVWCKAACGNNVHSECFEGWKRSRGKENVICVYCRMPWESENLQNPKVLLDQAHENEEGYLNIGKELGLPTYRDVSTYHYHDHDHGMFRDYYEWRR